MPGRSGLEVQKELQVVSPKTRVIISTANDHDSVRNAAIQAGAIAAFVKPFDDGAFLASVHQAVASESRTCLKRCWPGQQTHLLPYQKRRLPQPAYRHHPFHDF